MCEHVTATTLGPDSTTLAFGSVEIGTSTSLPLILQNNGTDPIHALYFQTDELDDNFEIGVPCNPDGPGCDANISALAPGSSTTATVRCAPHSVGAHTVHLEVASDTGLHLATKITLTCTATAATAPVLGVEPPVVVIATPTEVVSTVVHSTVYLSNLGTGSVIISDIRPVDVDPGAGFDWTYSLSGTCTSLPCTLAATEQVAVDVAFDPSQIAARHASLLVSFVDTIARTRSIPLTGVGQGATLQLFATPTMLDLGSTPLGKPTTATLHFSNTGNRNTTAMLAVAPVGPYAIAPPSMLTVTPIANSDVVVTCTPTAPGIAPTTITTTDSDTIAATSLTVAATCTGITTPLYSSATSIAIGEARVDGGPITQTIQVLSNGAPLTINTAPHLDVANANISIGILSGAVTPLSFDVTVMPQTEGDLASHVVVVDSVGDTLQIPVTGRVVKASYTVPASLDVGAFCVGQPTASSNLSLTSDGTATIQVMAPTTSDTSGFDLGFTAPTVYPATLLPSKTATISLTPERELTPGMLTATVTWTTDVASAQTTTTAITARFVDSGGAISPHSLDFGDVLVHLFEDDGQRVILQNCNGTVLELDPPTIKAPFSIDSPSFPTSLQPNETTTFSVGFHPTRVGGFDDTITISSPQLSMPLSIALHGNSITDAPPIVDAGTGSADDGSRSFYACTCNSSTPIGGAPIAFAFALIIWPRRRRGGSS